MTTPLPTDTLPVPIPDLPTYPQAEEAAWPPPGCIFYFDGLQDDHFTMNSTVREENAAARAVAQAEREAAAALAATPKKQMKKRRKQKKMMSADVSVLATAGENVAVEAP